MTHRQRSRLGSLFDVLRAHEWVPGTVAGWDEAEVQENYEVIVQSRLKKDNLALAAVALEHLAANQPDTVRGVMYSVVSAGWLPDTGKTSYGRIQRLLNDLRKKGVIPFSWIVDNIRQTMKPSSWSGLADFADTVAEAYRKDFWSSLPVCVEVIVEKDAVAGRVEPVTEEFNVALHALRGYCSTSFAWSIGRRWKQIRKPIHVYYIGDHDPSGRDIERSIIASLHKYADRDFTWRRLAVEPAHFDAFKIIPLQPKQNDRRYQAFVERYGPRCAEVEAIPAADLRDMLRLAIESHVPQAQWQRMIDIEAEEKRQWQSVMQSIKGAA